MAKSQLQRWPSHSYSDGPVTVPAMVKSQLRRWPSHSYGDGPVTVTAIAKSQLQRWPSHSYSYGQVTSRHGVSGGHVWGEAGRLTVTVTELSQNCHGTVTVTPAVSPACTSHGVSARSRRTTGESSTCSSSLPVMTFLLPPLPPPPAWPACCGALGQLRSSTGLHTPAVLYSTAHAGRSTCRLGRSHRLGARTLSLRLQLPLQGDTLQLTRCS